MIEEGADISVITWIVIGLIAGFIGGWLFELVGHAGVTGSNLYSMFVAAVGAVVVLVVHHFIRRAVA